jgi:hypothetical protein
VFSSVSIVTRVDDQGSKRSRGKDGIFFRHRVQTDSMDTQSAVQWLPRTLLSPGVKLPGREAGHSPQSSAYVINACSYRSTPSVHLHGATLS